MNLADDRVSRHNAMTSGRWIALLGLALTLPSYADSPWIGGPDCGDEIDLRRVDRMLSHRSPDGSDEIFGFYPADCDGGLYLVDLLGTTSSSRRATSPASVRTRPPRFGRASS